METTGMTLLGWIIVGAYLTFLFLIINYAYWKKARGKSTLEEKIEKLIGRFSARKTVEN